MIRRGVTEFDYLMDPHTAVGVHVGLAHREPGIPLVCLSTAHPAKFEDAIAEALPGQEVVHPTLAALAALPTRKQLLRADAGTIKQFIADTVSGVP